MGRVGKNRVNPRMAIKALQLANGDRHAAYTQYILLHYRTTGSLAPGCDNKELQLFYDYLEQRQKVEKEA